jgi:type III secretory pathway component EscV
MGAAVLGIVVVGMVTITEFFVMSKRQEGSAAP